MRFVDLFAGLGGFHLALSGLGHKCVFASELNRDLAEVYKKNFRLEPAGDIREVLLRDIPPHDILCAGFPCQPFSKAGDQRGLECPQWGDLIDYVIRILRYHQPKLFIIENVPNLVHHNGGKTWADVKARLQKPGYEVADEKLSPHMFGVPQIRERAFIVGRRGSLSGFNWPSGTREKELNIRSILDERPKDARALPRHFVEYLAVWQQLIDRFPKSEELPTFPIWAMEFGATYPYEDETPHARKYRKLGWYKGALGQSLAGLTPEEAKAALPSYALDDAKRFPNWKIEFIRKNRELYQRHKKIIDPWLPSIEAFAPSFQKLEWNCKGGKRSIWQYVIQFRASGIRVKKPTMAPSLVAMTTSQVPVIAWECRYMTPRECSRLQSMGKLKHLPDANTVAYKALGNAVNVKVVAEIAKALIEYDRSARKASKRPQKQSLEGRKPDHARSLVYGA